MKILKLFIALSLILTSLQGATTQADDTCDEACEFKEQIRRGFLIFSPRYFALGQNAHHGAFTSNGFSEPNRSLFDFNIIFGRHYDSGFDLGLSFHQGGQSNVNGVYTAAYGYFNAGLYAGYDLLGDSDTDLIVGSTLGYSWSELEVLSATQNGRINEGAVFWEPSISVAHKISNRFKLGVVASYMLPFANDRGFNGQDLGSQKIAPRGASIGLQFIFGRFGEDAAEPAKK